MKISDLILQLMNVRQKYGDLPIVGGYMTDDRPPTKVTVIDDNGVDVLESLREPVGVFLE